MRIVIFFGLILIGLTACKKRQVKKVEKAVTQGTWKITRFIDSGDDETPSYANATLVFDQNGTLVLNHGNSYSGTWSIGNDSDDDDHPSKDDLEFNISLPTPHESLSDDWHITDHSDSKITLEDLDDDEPHKSDYLTIEKM